MLHSWAASRGMAGRSFLSQARHWIKAVIEATAPHVCAYKPSLGFYQALGPVGLELLLEVRDLVPRDLPLIVDAKHGDLNSSSVLANYLFRELGADAVTLSPLAGQDIAAPFLLYPEKGVVITCHSSNQAARILQHFPSEEDPLYLRIVAESQLWATPEQLLLEVGTSDPAVLARVRQAAPERFLLLRSLWGEEEKLQAMLAAGLGSAGDGMLLPLPQNLLVEEGLAERAELLKQRINNSRDQLLARLEATAKDTEWVNRRTAVDIQRNEFESRLWPWETDGLASAEFQDWISKFGRESGLTINEIRPDIETKGIGNSGLRKMSVNVTGTFDVVAMEKFLAVIAGQNRTVLVDRLRISSIPISRYEMSLVTYLRPKGSAASPSQPAGLVQP
jgi:orotidine-5'-phosphate decarboxylase